MQEYTKKFMKENRVFTATDKPTAMKMIEQYYYSEPGDFTINEDGRVLTKAGYMTSLVIRHWRGGFIGFLDTAGTIVN